MIQLETGFQQSLTFPLTFHTLNIPLSFLLTGAQQGHPAARGRQRLVLPCAALLAAVAPGCPPLLVPHDGADIALARRHGRPVGDGGVRAAAPLVGQRRGGCREVWVWGCEVWM